MNPRAAGCARRLAETILFIGESGPREEQAMDESTATPESLHAALRRVVQRLKGESGADIVSLYLYDADSQSYYAPVAVGLPEGDLAGSIPDMRDQLARYRADLAEGKAPGELHFTHYGPNVWLTVTRRPLLARHAADEIDSSFIRRHHIQSLLGLPLLSGDRLIGLLYLDYVAKPGQARAVEEQFDADRLAGLEREASLAAREIERARETEERVAFAAMGKLARQLSAPPADGAADAGGFRRQLGSALAELLAATGLDGATIYELGIQRGRLDLVCQQGLPGAPATVAVPDQPAGEAGDPASAFARTALGTDLHLVATYPLRMAESLHGYLFVVSRDRLALLRKAPLIGLLLQTTADLIAGSLANRRLVATLEDTNQVLGALSRMSGVLLQPGATRQQVLDAFVRHLTDAQVPEFDFQLASAFLLDDGVGSAEPLADPAGPLVVRLAAGAATADDVDATPVAGGAGPARVPRWVQQPNRELSADDVLAFVARHWQVVVVAADPGDGSDGAATGDVVGRYPAEQVRHCDVPAVRSDGAVVASVPAILIGPAGRPAAEARRSPGGAPFTLDGDVFAASRHHDLVRVFVPFGLDPSGRASGVLEAGYHRSYRRQLDRTPIEALRACAAQLAVAVETARLYEEVKRHAEQLEISSDVSKAIAASIDLDQTLRLVSRHLVRLVDASLCQIAFYEEDGSAWYGVAASDEEEIWRRMRGERPETSFWFDLLERRTPLVIEDAQRSEQIEPYYARRFGIRSLLALPLVADDQPIGAVVLARRDRAGGFTAEEVQRTEAIAHQAAVAIKNARLHAYAEEEQHIQKDVVLVGFGQWGQKAYRHLLTLKQFLNFKTHVVTPERGEEHRARLEPKVQEILANGDAIYWDSPEKPARDELKRQLESSCYTITYVATPAATHLPVVAQYYDLSNVIVIEKPLGASPEAYREFLDRVDGSVELVAADHYFFKLEVRLLQTLLTEERTLKAFLDSVEEIEVELLEAKPLDGAALEIGIIADMIPHAFAIISLFTPIDRIRLAADAPLAIGRQVPLPAGDATPVETFVRLTATFPHQGRDVRLVIVAGKGVEDSKWIKLSGEKRPGGRAAFYKFDFNRGEAIDGTQTNLRAAIRRIREAGVPDAAHLTMLRHVIERRHPAVGILAIREAIRSNQRIQELQALARELLARGEWTPYEQGQRPDLSASRVVMMQADGKPAATVRIG
jgi:GAF domain-containing protein